MLELEASKSQMSMSSPPARSKLKYGKTISHRNQQLEQSDERALVSIDE